MTFDVVLAADLDWGIGKDNALPWPRLRADLQHFRRVTSDAPDGTRNAIVMGRNTWQSKEVAGKPLPRRLNVVITRKGLDVPEGVVVASSLDAALAAIATSGDLAGTFVVGGAQIFREAFSHPALRWVYLTRIEGRFGCDVVIPDLDQLGFAKVTWDGEQACEEAGVRFRIERLGAPASAAPPGR